MSEKISLDSSDRLSNFRMKSLKHFAGMPCYRYSSVFFMVLDF